MAAAFGMWELSTAQYTRAVFDEFDEEEDENQQGPQSSRTVLSVELNKEIKCSVFLLAVGKVSTCFSTAFMLSSGSEVIGRVGLDSEEQETSSEVKTRGSLGESTLYRLTENPDVVVCHADERIEPQRTVEWADKVIEKLNPSSVVILTSSPSCHYQTPEPDALEPDFVRTLKTDRWRDEVPFQFLEQPNTVAGLPAAVLSHCQVHGKEAVLYICYTESSLVDVRSVKILKRILKKEPFSEFKQPDESCVSKVLKSFAEEKPPDHNLYI